MTTTPNPITAIPGAVVPGATPGTTPPILPGSGTPDPSAQVSEMTKRLLQTLAQASQRKQFAGTPVPGAIPGQQSLDSARSIGMNTANPRGWGLQRFAAGIQTSIQNAVSQEKQKKLNKAEADWTYLQSALNEKYAAEASKDPKAIAAAQQKVDVVMTDPKKLKDMAKALNQDWLNPEKTTVYGEALKKVSAKTKQTEQQTQQADAQKQQAAQGLKGMFQKLMQQRQQPQLTDEQKKQMSAEIEAKAPTTTTGMSAQEQREAALGILDIEKAAAAQRQKYSVTVGPDGKAWAWNTTNPKDAFQLHDAETGDTLSGQVKSGAPPKVAALNGVPYGVTRGKDTIVPGSPNWTKEDQQLYDGAVGAARQKQQLKIPPEIGDQIGAPPDPKDYTKGTSDPEYAAALRTYGKKAYDLEVQKASAQGVARAKASNDYRPVQVMDNDGNVYYTTAKDAISQGLAGASEGGKLRPKQAQMKDIETASSKARDAINNLKPNDFSPDQVALLRKAMSEEDAGVAHTVMQNLAMRATNDQQQDFIIWITQLNERAMSLRNIAGMGAGAQDLRNAIRAMLPGLASGDTKMMKKQLDAFDQQVKVLEEGVASPGRGGAGKLVGTGAKDTTTPKKADEIQFTPIS
jgi:hypothetical protein